MKGDSLESERESVSNLQEYKTWAYLDVGGL